MATGPLISTISTLVASTVGALIAVYLKDWFEGRRDARLEHRIERRMRVRTDRATFNQRLTILIRSHLGSYIRGGKWFSDEADLRRLIADLENGNYEHFLDRHVNGLWRKLVRKTVILVRKRMDGTIGEMDIQFYNVMRQEWEDAAKRSFGPFPRPREMPNPRTPEARPEPSRQAA